jgi:hypothetical protein
MAAAAQAVPPLTESKMDEARRLEVAGALPLAPQV